MLTFVFLVSLTATTVLLLAIAAEEAARVTRAFLAQANDEIKSGGATTAVAATQALDVRPSHESAELRAFPQRARAQVRGNVPANLDDVPDRAA